MGNKRRFEKQTYEEGVVSLCDIASQILSMEGNSSTHYALTHVLRMAVNKSYPQYKGNNNMLNVQYISENALDVIEGKSKEKLISEHIIPLSSMYEQIYETGINSKKDLISICKNYFEMCLITKSEDKKLTKTGLTKSMPEGWNENNGRKFARYEHKEVNIIPIDALKNNIMDKIIEYTKKK